VTYLQDMAADYLFKPNGLWYAMGDEWQAWCDENEELINILSAEWQPRYQYSHELDVEMSKMCVLDEVKAVMNFHWKYGYNVEGGFKAIDWKKVMAVYSGIEVRNYDALKEACAFLAVIWLRNWGVSGGCIWDLSAVDWNTRNVVKRI